MAEMLYRRKTELLEADIGEELVALDPDGGRCFGFNDVATTVWRELASPRSFEQLVERLMSEYDVPADQCEAELQTLLDDLVDRQLLAVSPSYG